MKNVSLVRILYIELMIILVKFRVDCTSWKSLVFRLVHCLMFFMVDKPSLQSCGSVRVSCLNHDPETGYLD